MKLLDEFRAQDIEPKVDTYNSVISACEVDGGQWKIALI